MTTDAESALSEYVKQLSAKLDAVTAERDALKALIAEALPHVRPYDTLVANDRWASDEHTSMLQKLKAAASEGGEPKDGR